MATSKWTDIPNPKWDEMKDDIYRKSVEFNAKVAAMKPGDLLTIPATPNYAGTTWRMHENGELILVNHRTP